jgi:hypothetical protein
MKIDYEKHVPIFPYNTLDKGLTIIIKKEQKRGRKPFSDSAVLQIC